MVPDPVVHIAPTAVRGELGGEKVTKLKKRTKRGRKKLKVNDGDVSDDEIDQQYLFLDDDVSLSS